MPPKPENTQNPKSEKMDLEEFAAQMREMKLHIDSISRDHEVFQSLLTNQNSTPNSPFKPPKITLLPFDGSNPLDWLFQADQFFDLSQVAPHQRMQYVAFFMKGEALSWYKWMVANHQISTWEAFQRSLELRFGPSSYDNHQAALFKLTQKTSVTEYQKQFEALSNRILGMPPEMLLNCFILGLKPEIQRELFILKPHSLSHAVGLAKLFESKFQDGRPPQPPHRFQRPSPPPPITPPPHNPSILPSPPSPLPIRRVTTPEMQDRRNRGLCYNCDDKYHPGHRCTKKQFLLLLADEPPASETSEPTPDSPVSCTIEDITEAPEPIPEVEHFHLSTAALKGPSSTRTLRVTGRIQELSVTILIDSGSSHNILQPRVAEFLHLPVEAIPSFVVTVGNGQTIQCSGHCSDIPVHMAGKVFPVSFFVLPIHGADVVLGVQWLSTLGPFLSDFKVPSIQFVYDNTPVTIVGNPPATPTQASLAQFNRFIFTDAIESAHTVTLAAVHPDEPTNTLTSTSHPDITNLLSHFGYIFTKPQGLPPHRTLDHHIHLQPNSQPVNTKPYRYPHAHKEQMTQMIKEMLQDGIIKPSTSPFSSPVILVRKKDGTWRFCIDYRALNAITIKDRFPIPTVDELLDELHGANCFSKLDLCSGYHQIWIDPGNTFKTAFRTVNGHFEFLVMPFGLSNAPSTFQATMNDIFRAILRKFVLIFFDDILVYSKDWTSHLQHLHYVMTLMQQHQLFAKASKCQFGVSTVAYLGHIISKDGVSADPEKIHAIQSWPPPVSVSKLRGFLGLTGYYRKFVHHYADIAAPLTDLLKHQRFTWTDKAQQAFETLQQRMTSLPVLGIPDFSLLFDVTTDASGTAVGAILSQASHPLAYFSKKMCPRMQASSAYEREMYAITSAVKKWRHYLIGRHFRIFTDQQSLRGLIGQHIQTPAQQKWLTKLLGFDYEILYTPGRTNKVVDALSRRYETCESVYQGVSFCQPLLLQQLQEFYASHEVGKLLLTKFDNNQEQNRHFSVQQGLLYFKGRLFIPLETELRKDIIREHHSSPAGGHSGNTGTLARITSSFAWPNLAKDVQDFLRDCLVCQQSKYSTHKPFGLLQPLPIPQHVWEDISMDFITHLPLVKGKTTIWVIVDRLSKYSHFIALPAQVSAASLATIFLAEIYRLHGMPRTIVSDIDRLFISKFWSELFRLHGTTLAYNSSYHPQTDGQTEVTNRILETFLRCFVTNSPHLWVSYLPLAEYWYNTTYQSAIRMSPFEALYGRTPPTVCSYMAGSTAVASLDDLLIHRKQVLERVRENLCKAQLRMRSLANAHRLDRTFQVGDWVWLKLQPYRQVSVRGRGSPKLAKRFHGPFKVQRIINKVAYELLLPPSAKIHPVFHVSKLKPFHGNPPSQMVELDPAVTGTLVEQQPQTSLAFRMLQTKHGPKRQVLIQWEGTSPLEASWEDIETIEERYPHYNLGDKIVLEELGNDTSTKEATKGKEPSGPSRPIRKKESPIWLKDYVREPAGKEKK